MIKRMEKKKKEKMDEKKKGNKQINQLPKKINTKSKKYPYEHRATRQYNLLINSIG